jgi:alpha-glucosidase
VSAWCRNAVVYEVYVRSFADSDGDGLGDLEGVRSRLPYLAALGVDAVWLTPFFPSPGADHGYDVSDYVDVDPRFGSLAGFDALVADAHALGLRVVIDLVPNHTSIEHPWFREHPDYYVWTDEPNNWLSVFGGPAWTLDEERGRFYLHLFAAEQPDLDWHNPDVQREFEAIYRFWLDRGVDGIRVDVAHGLFKDPDLADEAEPVPGAELHSFDRRRAIDRPELHPYYRGLRRLVDSYDGDRFLVGEVYFREAARAWGATAVACRCRGRRTRPASGSRPARRGCRRRPASARAASGSRRDARGRRSSYIARRSPGGRTASSRGPRARRDRSSSRAGASPAP